MESIQCSGKLLGLHNSIVKISLILEEVSIEVIQQFVRSSPKREPPDFDLFIFNMPLHF